MVALKWRVLTMWLREWGWGAQELSGLRRCKREKIIENLKSPGFPRAWVIFKKEKESEVGPNLVSREDTPAHCAYYDLI